MPQTFRTAEHEYVELACLRSGEARSTYRVRRQGDGEEFILKQLRVGSLRDWKEFDLFEREMGTLASIDHARIPKLVDKHLDESAGTYVLVETLIRGTTLREMLASHQVLDAEDTESYLKQSLLLLMYLHGCSPPVIHRDLKPSNIMIADGNVHFLDFGAVKVGNRESTAMTTVGTFGYMGPEQILGRAEARSDLFGLGMTFIAMATGLEPSDLPHDPQTGQVDPSSVLSVPENLRRVLLALIQPGVDQRPANAGAALELFSAPAAPPAGAAMVPVQHMIPPAIHTMDPYRLPGHRFSEQDKAYLRQHTLQKFPVWAAVLLHFMTFGLFSLIHYGNQHDRLPKAMGNDPSAGKAIGFSFIPYFNMYWWIWNPLRLADRLNLQFAVRDEEPGVPRGLILACGIVSIIPYFNFLFGLPLWGVGVAQLQSAINRLAEQAEHEEPLQLTGAAPPAAYPQLPPGAGVPTHAPREVTPVSPPPTQPAPPADPGTKRQWSKK